MYKFTFIIGYRHKKDRFINLKRTLDWVNSFSGVELILVEQDKHTKIGHLNLNCKHIFVKSDQPYNRSWGFNVGLKNSNSDIIVFGDSDIIMDPHKFIEALKMIKDYDMVSPYTSVIDLDPKESTLPLPNILKIKKKGRSGINPCGGIAIFRKEAAFNIGGWFEKFIDWGGEDDHMFMKTKHFLNWKELEGSCYHLYHQRVVPDQKLYKNTLSILQKTSKMTKEQLKRQIDNTVNKIGMKNLYDNF